MANKSVKTRNPQSTVPKKRLGGRMAVYALFSLIGCAAASAVFLARGEGSSRKQPALPVPAARP